MVRLIDVISEQMNKDAMKYFEVVKKQASEGELFLKIKTSGPYEGSIVWVFADVNFIYVSNQYMYTVCLPNLFCGAKIMDKISISNLKEFRKQGGIFGDPTVIEFFYNDGKVKKCGTGTSKTAVDNLIPLINVALGKQQDVDFELRQP